MFAVSDARGISQVMVIVEYGVRQRGCHVSYLLRLSHKVQSSMFYELQYIRHTIRAMQVNISLFLANESLVAQWFEQFPSPDEVLHHIDVRPCLYVEIPCIKEATDV